MGLEQQISSLVQASENLTSAVNNKIGEIDQHLSNLTNQIQGEMNNLKSMLPRIIITKNQVLKVNEGERFPSGFSVHSDISMELYKTVSADPSTRQSDVISLLTEIERDLGFDIRKTEYYRQQFNIYKLKWTQGTTWLAFPQSADGVGLNDAIPLGSFLTIGAFVKVISGSVRGAWGEGAVEGKWRFTGHRTGTGSAFGSYTHLHPMRNTSSGELLVALPAAITGFIENPSDWFDNIIL
ncbi:hypothetical protein HU985_13330 [Photobacterium damselae subsp. damselae]|uniref:hypothetical protein n=1 Tax=Photobacterium damselae TaxID=38293 RepID=UPI001593E2EE|nr:hypothetical protein [Photobacterium damselae]NVH51878.1 hypothetical protein [Photobacterium damselae subsp. damselae]NVO82732.1 hypothetical protein [Photobacterium damselae subsp. damselae]